MDTSVIEGGTGLGGIGGGLIGGLLGGALFGNRGWNNGAWGGGGFPGFGFGAGLGGIPCGGGQATAQQLSDVQGSIIDSTQNTAVLQGIGDIKAAVPLAVACATSNCASYRRGARAPGQRGKHACIRAADASKEH